LAQLTNDCFAGAGPLMRAADALELILARLARVTEGEVVGLGHAIDRILVEPVVSPIDVPSHDNSAVDGYAVYFDDLAPEAETRLPVAGRAAAGHPLRGPATHGAAVRIFTGAVMPAGEDGTPGPDTVMMQEDCRVEGDAVVVMPGIKRGANRRSRGEDVTAGRTILEAGIRLRPQDVGLAASVGVTSLHVSRKLRVALFSTGDELAEPGERLKPGAIYDANRFAIMGMLQQLGCEVTDLGILPDRREVIRLSLSAAAQDHDLLITSGGVSVGEEDHVKTAVEALGRLHLWRLAIRPGRPIALGQIDSEDRAVPFVGLPGNPVAVMVTFLRIARPMILKLMGGRDLAPTMFRVRAGFDYKKKKDRREWLRVRLVAGEDGELRAEKYPHDGAGILTSMVEADGLIELPEELVRLVPGATVDFLPFSELR
jgi:molybdopterin molybdotransferase